MMAGEEERGFSPPYLAFSKITGLLQRMREQGTPARIDRSYLTWLPGIDQTYLLAALRTFGLIDEEGRLQGSLKALIAAEPEDEKRQIAQLLRTHYADVFALGPNATQSQLESIFRLYGPRGSTLRKAITFFLKGAEYAGLPVSPHFKAPRASSTPTGTRRITRRKPAADSKPSRKRDAGASSQDDAATLRTRYLEMLMKKAEDDPNEELLNRIERLLGYEQSQGLRVNPPAT